MKAKAKISAVYVKAYWSYIDKLGLIGEVIDDCQKIADIYNNSSSFSLLTKNRLVSTSQMAELIKKIFKKFSISKQFTKLAVILANNRRLSLLKLIIGKITDLYYHNSGQIKVEVSSASSLSSKQKKNIKSQLDQQLNKDSIIDWQEDQGLIAGLRIKYNSLILDSSLANYFAQLESKIEQELS